MKKKITETQLRKMISESIQSALNEIGNTEAGQWMLGRLAGRNRLTRDDYDRHHCEDGKNVEPFMNGYDWEDTPRWAEDLSQQYDNAGKPDEFYDAYWKQKDYLDNYADSMKSKIRANTMNGRNQTINEGGEFKAERDTLRKNLAYPHNPSESEMRHLHETELLTIREDLSEWYTGIQGYYPRPMGDVAQFYETAQDTINKIGETLYGWKFEN